LPGANLTYLNISNNLKLDTISISMNKIKASLNMFCLMNNLKVLDIGQVVIRFDSGDSPSHYNRINSFSGSLEALKDCKKLERLNIGYQ